MEYPDRSRPPLGQGGPRRWWRRRSAVTAGIAVAAALGLSGVPSLASTGAPDAGAALKASVKARVASVLAQTAGGDQGGDGGLTEGGDQGTGTEGGQTIDEGPSGGGGGSLSSGRDRITGLTRNLRLGSAEIQPFDLDDDEDEFVIFRFESFVRSVEDERGFRLVGPAADSDVTATDARILQGSPDEVLVAFPSGTDLSAYSIATVDSGAVEDEVGQGNVPTTVPLDGSDLAGGRSAGPDLVSVTLNDTLDRVTYRFDENLDEDMSASASDFGFYTLDGHILTGDRVISIEDNAVIVAFDDQVEDGVRFFALGGAVEDRQGTESVPGSIGDDTTSPDLVDVSRVDGDTQFDFRFDEDVAGIDPSGFAVYDDNGNRFEGEDWARIDSETVRIIFPDIDDFTDEIVVAAVDDDAVEATDGSGIHNTVGSVTINDGDIRTGRTSGPDLTEVEVDADSGEVKFFFDENVDDDMTYDPDDYFVVTAAGDLVRGRTFVEADENWVLILFDKNVVEAADGFVVADGATQDFAGNESPAGSL